jgi:hypothetical protein
MIRYFKFFIFTSQMFSFARDWGGLGKVGGKRCGGAKSKFLSARDCGRLDSLPDSQLQIL